MHEDRLKRDCDSVENLKDIIRARDERTSAFSDDVDAMDDIEDAELPVDPNVELTWPHPKTESDEEGRLGINTELMGTPDEKQIEFDWQDSVEEMLETDPSPSEGMGEDVILEDLTYVQAEDLTGTASQSEFDSETSTAPTKKEEKKYRIHGSEKNPQQGSTVPLESAMDTGSDELDISIWDKFAEEFTERQAERTFEEMEEASEEEKSSPDNQ